MAAGQGWGVLVRRVESKANVADGPTRHYLGDLEALAATWSRPRMPHWIGDLKSEFGFG